MDNDDPGARALIGFGRKRLRQLHRDMGFQNLHTYSNKIILQSGYTVTATSSQGINKVFITAPGGKGRKDKVEYECFCNCNFAIGQVREITDIDGLSYLTVSSCREDRYALYENILSSDFTPWEVDDVVIIMAYNSMLFDCDKGNTDAIGCKPVIDETNTVGAEAWRTTFRVLPLCALTQPKWIKYASPV